MRGRWILFVVGVIVLVPRSVAQPPDKKDAKTTTLSLAPAPLPVPALKYQLLPDLRDRVPGNQIPAFYKCFMEQYAFYRGETDYARREKWTTAPLAELAGEKDVVGYGGVSARQADYAARLDSVDWAVLDQLKKDGINLLLPDVQQMRELGRVLHVRMRGEVARKDFPAAVRTAQTLFALARSFEAHPTLIGNLVGMSIESAALNALEELVQQPGAPNLYWALTDLPDPVVGIRNGLQGERAFVSADLDVLLKAEPIPPPALDKLVNGLDFLLEATTPGKAQKAAEWFADRVAKPETVAGARDRLKKLGFKPDALDALAPLQLLLTDEYTRYKVDRDDLMKWNNVPAWDYPADLPKTDKLPPGIFGGVIPACLKVKEGELRFRQRVALLRAVEMIRAYTAEHGGVLPPTLAACQLPVPTDPVTGKPVVYETQNGMAVVRGASPTWRKEGPVFNRAYEIRVQK